MGAFDEPIFPRLEISSEERRRPGSRRKDLERHPSEE